MPIRRLPMTDLGAHYRREDGHYLVEVNLTSARQLFSPLDASPFLEKDLDDRIERYIVDTVREFSLKTPLKLCLYLPPGEAGGAESSQLARAIGNYFEYQSQVADRDLILKLRQGRTSLVIGLLFLFLCIFLRQLLGAADDGMAMEILQEGLLISGWVAMWRPIQIFLYDWWPIRHMRQVYRKLRAMPVEVRTRP